MTMKLTPKAYGLRQAFGEAFPADQFITGYEPSAHPFVPQPDPHWQWDRALLRDLVIWWQEGHRDALYLFGPTGAGKSSALVNFCAALQIPLYEKTIYEGLEFIELIERTELVDGTTLTHDGVLPLAMGVSGYPGLFCANEIDRADPGLLCGLYEVLEGRGLVTGMGGAEAITPHAGFRIAATGNTTMQGDSSGLYVGAKPQDLALQDRFWKVRVNYPDPQTERAILAKLAPQLPAALRDKLVEVAHEIRAMFIGESDRAEALPITLSTRTLGRWARMTWSYRGAQGSGVDPVYYALDRALLNAVRDTQPEVYKAVLTVVEGKLGRGADSP